VRLPPPDLGPWTAARFPTHDSRDRFLLSVLAYPTGDVEVEPMPDEDRGARARWRPGHFLGLNDLVYANGGRFTFSPSRGR
jgi:hypothetical protein